MAERCWGCSILLQGREQQGLQGEQQQQHQKQQQQWPGAGATGLSAAGGIASPRCWREVLPTWLRMGREQGRGRGGLEKRRSEKEARSSKGKKRSEQ